MASISPVEERVQRADARRNRERILAAAKEVFGTSGDAAQMDDIARTAGVGVGTLYRHFPNKDALIGELIRLKFVGITERAHRYLEEVDDPWECFAGFVWESAEQMAEDQAQQRMMWLATAEAFAFAREQQQELAAATAKIVGRAHKAGVLRKDWSAEDLPALMCALSSSMQMGAQAHSPVAYDWRKLLEVTLDGLRAS
jgi:AcrR family transcriptional regulator